MPELGCLSITPHPDAGWAVEGVTDAKWDKANRDIRSSERLFGEPKTSSEYPQTHHHKQLS